MTVNPRADAQAVVGDAYDVRVLEPSPPAVRTDPFSDDPTARGEVTAGRRLLSPVTYGDAGDGGGDETWDAFATAHAEHASWCADRWLGAWKRLQPIAGSDAYAATLDAWHALAEHVVAGARFRVNRKIGLRWTTGGFGTPFFGEDEQVRIESASIVHVTNARELRAPVTTLADAALFVRGFVGIPGGLFEPATDGTPSRALAIDPDAAARLDDWFGFATSVLAQLRADLAAGAPSLIQLWPEHFDAACDLGDEALGARANFGASPGDAEHAEPYLYVGPWARDRIDRNDPFWAEDFGASLPYAALLDAPDQRAAALAFFHEGAARLGADGR
jgi:hypothetical protein